MCEIENNTQTPYIYFNFQEALSQIGKMNVFAISGGRVKLDGRNEYNETRAIFLPVNCGYTVKIQLHANDTYTVQRIFERGGKVFLKGEMTGVYCEELGETCYKASCYYEKWGS